MADRKFPLTDVILGAGISAILLAGFFIGIGPLDSLELKLYDLRARMHATHQVGNESRIFQAVIKHSIALACLVGAIVMFYSFVAPGLIPVSTPAAH